MIELKLNGGTGPASHVVGASNLLLTDLEKVRGQALAAMALMDAVTSETVADRCRISNTRWQLSQAGLRGCTALAAVLQYLIPRVSPNEAKALKSLQGDHLEILRYSSEYIGHWTLDRIQAEWPAYCEAFRGIRWKMTTYISAEKEVLFPILRREALGGRAGSSF